MVCLLNNTPMETTIDRTHGTYNTHAINHMNIVAAIGHCGERRGIQVDYGLMYMRDACDPKQIFVTYNFQYWFALEQLLLLPVKPAYCRRVVLVRSLSRSETFFGDYPRDINLCHFNSVINVFMPLKR